MPVSKSAARGAASERAQRRVEKEMARPRRAPERLYYVRLRRGGPQGEMGLNRLLHGGKLYLRRGIYRVNAEKRRELLRTRKFEEVPDTSEDLAQAKREAQQARGVSLEQHARARRGSRRRSRALMDTGARYSEPAGEELTEEEAEDFGDDGSEDEAEVTV